MDENDLESGTSLAVVTVGVRVGEKGRRRYLKEPNRHSSTAVLRSASGRTMAGFLASNPKQTRNLWGEGWDCWI